MGKRNAPIASKENLSTNLFVIRAVLDGMEHQIWKQKIVYLKVKPATHVRKERTRRQKVLSTPPIVILVLRANFPTMLEIQDRTNVHRVQSIISILNRLLPHAQSVLQGSISSKKVLLFVFNAMLENKLLERLVRVSACHVKRVVTVQPPVPIAPIAELEHTTIRATRNALAAQQGNGATQHD